MSHFLTSDGNSIALHDVNVMTPGVQGTVQAMIDTAVNREVGNLRAELTNSINTKQAAGNYQVANGDVTTGKLCMGNRCIDSGEFETLKNLPGKLTGTCCFYHDSNHDNNKRHLCLPRGDWDMVDLGFNDNIQSLKCDGSMTARVYENHFEGHSKQVDAGASWNESDLRNHNLHRKISAVQIRFGDESV